MNNFFYRFFAAFSFFIHPYVLSVPLNFEGMAPLECEIKSLSSGYIAGLSLNKEFPVQQRKGEHTFSCLCLPLADNTSLNWSGYITATDFISPRKEAVQSVFGVWKVPALPKEASTNAVAIWIGIDGYFNTTMEQVGTLHVGKNSTQKNIAWFQIYPKGLFEIVDFPVDAGDIISSEVSYVTNGLFRLYIVNHTKKVFFVIPSCYTHSKKAERSSAQWIVEYPSFSDQKIELSNYPTLKFSDCNVTFDHFTGAIDDRHWQYQPLWMTGAFFPYVIKAGPSELISNGSAFTLYR